MLLTPNPPLPIHRTMALSVCSAFFAASTFASSPPLADFKGQAAPRPIQDVANWVVQSKDNRDQSFAIVDKAQARLFVFQAKGELRGASPVLLGSARGDDSVPGIGQRKMADILPKERTTPAGRFVVEPGRNAQGEDIFWVDYDAAISMHRVRVTVKAERRLERLASATPADNRISYGCINVPVSFFNQVVNPAFSKQHGVVYVLPETRPLSAVFTALKAKSSKPGW